MLTDPRSLASLLGSDFKYAQSLGFYPIHNMRNNVTRGGIFGAEMMDAESLVSYLGV